MTIFLFVYGTLKEGFPNHHINLGRRVDGVFRTQKRFKLYVVELPNESRAPWLIFDGDEGECVSGELYEVPASALPQIDALEEVGHPDGYERVTIEVRRDDSNLPPLAAHAYLKQPIQLNRCAKVEGPYPEYTLEMSQSYRLNNSAT